MAPHAVPDKSVHLRHRATLASNITRLPSTGRIHVYTGNGKGKTTAALGLAVRARAAGKRVAIVFFDKGGEHYSERTLLKTLDITWFAYGLDRIDPVTQRFRFGVVPDDVAQATAGMKKAIELLPSHDVLILDEVNTAVALGMLAEQSIEALLDQKPASTELVLTGRIEVSKAARPLHCDGSCITGGGKPHEHRPSYFDRADLVTEMRLVQHYFYRGVPAERGIDY